MIYFRGRGRRRLAHKCFITEHSVAGGAPFIPMNAAQWSLKLRKLNFLAMKMARLLA